MELFASRGSAVAGEHFCSDTLKKQAEAWNADICSPYYRVMMKQDETERMAAWVAFANGLCAFTEQIEENGFYKNSSAPNIVDLTVFPWVHRLDVLQHHKDFTLRVSGHPKNAALVAPENGGGERFDAWTRRLFAWRDRMEAVEAVKSTLADREKLITVYRRYADGTGKSKVADAVFRGLFWRCNRVVHAFENWGFATAACPRGSFTLVPRSSLQRECWPIIRHPWFRTRKIETLMRGPGH